MKQPCREYALEQPKYKRFYTLLEQEQLMHPLILRRNALCNGGLRLRVAIEKGYDGIDCFVSNDQELIHRLTIIQQENAQNYFSIDELEPNELIHVKN